MTAPANPVTATLSWLGYMGHRYQPLALLFSAVLLTIGGSLLAWKWWIAVLLIMVGAAIPALELWWKRTSESLDDVVSAREKLLEEELAPLLELAATVTAKPRPQRRADAKAAAERAASGLKYAFDTVPGVRVVVFTVSDDGTRMTPYRPAGRQSRPGDFVRGTARGDRAFEVLENLRERFIIEADLRSAPRDRWAGTGQGYQTFISAPIRSLEDGFGLLTIDAPVAGTLDRRHAATVALFAAALGVLFAEAARGG